MAYQEMGAYEGDDPGPYWHDQIEAAQKVFEKWEKRGHKIVKRYRDERDAVEMPRVRYNILWSNIQVLFPALYGRQAKPEVSRRYMDQDPVGRLASTMLERVMEYETTQFGDFDQAMRGAVEDRLLPGRGTAWIRYEPVIVNEKPEASEAAGQMEEPGEAQIYDTVEEPTERIDAAHSPIDYVYWTDFLHSPARTWDEVWWVSRAVYMTKDEGIERFGEVFANVGLDSSNTDMDAKNPMTAKNTYDKKAKVFEIWNKRTGKVCWIAKGYPQALDERDDPLELEEFFPCPRPLMATTTTGTMIPVPDYAEYEDQAQELDNLTQRIYLLTKACKAVGVFNAEFKELGRLFTEGVDNKLFPVTSWAAMSEKGGLKGAIDMMDTSQIIVTLRELYAAREQVKQAIYEIMGISDILRGASKAQETLGAQQLKANFGSLRMRSSQGDVARFASDIFKLKAQVICKFYPPELIVQMSGVMDTPDGQNPQLLQAAIQMLSNSTIRDFHIAVEADSLAQIDEQAEKQGAQEAIQAIGMFLREAIPMISQAPETLPMASEMLLFLVRRFRAGRGLESAVERAMKALEQKAAMAQQQPAGPPPEMLQMQADQQAEQMRMQAQAQTEQMKMQAQAQIEQGKAQLEMQMQEAKMQAEMQLAQMKADFETVKQNNELQIKAREMAGKEEYERWKAELDAATKIMVARIGSNPGIDLPVVEAAAAQITNELGGTIVQAMDKITALHDNMANLHGESMQNIGAAMQKLSAPKRVIRGPDGMVVGVEAVQ
ncbi:MAG: hypothetical protein EBR82_46700 [Caulobacteraceae bacterium]|nr:hypothetical protein [Caulobacteraceae bacterium]